MIFLFNIVHKCTAKCTECMGFRETARCAEICPIGAPAADSINIPTLIVVGGDDDLKSGARILHQHIKSSRYVEIKGAVHGTAQWRPDVFNPAVLQFLEAVESGQPVAGESILE